MEHFEDIDRDLFVERLLKYTHIKVDEAESIWYSLSESQQQFPRLQAALIAFGDKK